ncbi:MAG: site-2 protease family protein [Polyangiaceae bacterium]|nr:site-2 protease family protein [Polyangiaceae bacterium]
MSLFAILVAVLGVGLLMVVHEGGHHLVARAFGMRVLRFSIGFGPTLWRHQPRGSDTTYQIALIPFFAYVQVDGMNPFEDNDPNDKGSYANATLTARIATIVAGPLANYLFASVLFFAAFMIGGKEAPSTTVKVHKDGPAAVGKMKSGDKVVNINGKEIVEFEQMRQIILRSPNKKLKVVVLRKGKRKTLEITPETKKGGQGGWIKVSSRLKFVPMGVQEAAKESVIFPALVVKRLVVALSRFATGEEKPELAGPVGIVKVAGKAADLGLHVYLGFLGALSAYLGGFNLLPFPALDGGRLMFLGYEAVARRQADARMEARVHMVGLLMLLALIFVVTIFDVKHFGD